MATTKAERRRTVMNTTNFDPSILAETPSGSTLAPNPPPPAAPSATTPSKTEKPSRSPAPRQSAQSVSSVSSTPSSRHASQKTLDQVLAVANPPGDLQSALTMLLDERNSAAQQNAQLWRVIEKQKSNLASATKDLERIRAERERYRRLFEETTTASGSGSELERRPPQGRPSNRAVSGVRAVSHSRAPIFRHQSDDAVHQGSSREGSSHLNGHAEESEALPSAPTGAGSTGVQPSVSSSVDRDTMGAQASRLPARSESLPVANGSSSTPLRDGPSASSISEAPVLPPPSVHLPDEQAVSAAEPDLSQPIPSDSATLSAPTNKRRERESRISLPDEARQYIANMQNSPLLTPDEPVAGVAPPVTFQHPPPPPQAGVLPSVTAVSPMNFDGTFAQSMTPGAPVQQAQAATNGAPSYPKTPTQSSVSGFQAPPPPPPLPNVQSRPPVDSSNDTDDDYSYDEHSSTVYSPAESNSRQAIPTIIRNAPSMTSMNTLVNPSFIQTTSLRSSTQDDSASLDSSPVATSPTTSTASTPPPNQYSAPPLPAQPPKMARTQSSQTTTTMAPPKLTPYDLSTAIILVPISHIRANDRGKEVLSFVIEVVPDQMAEREGWKIEKLYSDVLALDVRVRQSLGRSALKRIAALPDAKLFKDNAPSKVDQRKMMLQAYLQSVLCAPWKNPADVTGFFTSDVVSHARAPVAHPGYKEGYLTKRGKNFGGWKTRYFVLQSPVLEYYESRGGAHLGSITLTGSQIGRQQRQPSRDSEDENAYRHAFLIIESKRGPSGTPNRHVLCAESDEERDSWVEVLVRYVVGEYDRSQPDPPSQTLSQSQLSQSQSRASTSSFQDQPRSTQEQPRRNRAMSKDEILKGSALPISQLAPDASNAKLFQAPPPPPEATAAPAPTGSVPIPIDNAAKQMLGHNQSAQEVPLSSSLPSHLDVAMGGTPAGPGQRSNSELGHYPDMPPPRKVNRASFHPSASGGPSHSHSYPQPQPQQPRAPSPDKVKISGPMNGIPIPAGYRFGGKDPDTSGPSAGNDRERKAKSGRFWGFGRTPGDKPPPPAQPAPAVRAVFGIALQDSLAIAQIANLPAIVFRCIEYLEAKKADQEEGIYRLSGSSAVIKNLKDRFNTEGDVNLVESEDYWDPHAVAGLLKSYLRELPSSILTRDLHLLFLAVIDLADPQERVSELASLISQLPLANYSLLRALTAHLILVVQNSHVNKMTMRNVGIVFSPTLGIPAGVFSLMLNEFNRVFSVEAESTSVVAESGSEAAAVEVEAETNLAVPPAEQTASSSMRTKRTMSDPSRRNSRSYNDAHADKLLGFAGRSLKVDEESDEGEEAIVDESDSEDETDPDSHQPGLLTASPPGTPAAPGFQHRVEAPSVEPHRGHSAAVAATRGLNIATSRQHQRTPSGLGPGPGLPQSPRPPGRLPGSPAASSASPATPRI
ncbi:RhoGAP-domain-containing protein [Ceratobasidium sp. AG-I]|nr:RhoGAP-domain-containing protein [Ceratobasidium sp. AG-I]